MQILQFNAHEVYEFLRGDKTAKQIAEEVSTADHPVSPPTIYAWAKKDGWGEQKAVAVADKKQEIAETEGQRFAASVPSAQTSIPVSRHCLNPRLELMNFFSTTF